jgi:hypothetical protein
MTARRNTYFPEQSCVHKTLLKIQRNGLQGVEKNHQEKSEKEVADNIRKWCNISDTATLFRHVEEIPIVR